MDAEMLLRSGETITLSPAQLRSLLVDSSRYAIELERNDFLNKKECCKALGGRRTAERYARMGILPTNTTCENGEWRVFPIDMEKALKYQKEEQQERAFKKRSKMKQS